MKLKSIMISDVQEKWLKIKAKKLDIKESEIIRKLIDKEIETEKKDEKNIRLCVVWKYFI